MGPIWPYPIEGRDAYNYKNDKEHYLGIGSFSNVFRATRKHDNYTLAIKKFFCIFET